MCSYVLLYLCDLTNFILLVYFSNTIDRFVIKRKAPSSPPAPTPSDLDYLPWDPSDRKRISEYPSNQRSEVIRRYLIRGP